MYSKFKKQFIYLNLFQIVCFWLTPFHAAEQRSNERKSDSAERSDIPKRPLFMSSEGSRRPAVKRRAAGCLFWFVFAP